MNEFHKWTFNKTHLRTKSTQFRQKMMQTGMGEYVFYYPLKKLPHLTFQYFREPEEC